MYFTIKLTMNYFDFDFATNLYSNVANSNKSDNLAISCQWQVLTGCYLMRSDQTYCYVQDSKLTKV